MIERIYERARGMAQVSRRLFSGVREPGLPMTWAATVCDPFDLLENCLAPIVGGVEESTDAESTDLHGAEYRRRPVAVESGFGAGVAEHASIASRQFPVDRQPRRAPMPRMRWNELPSLPNLPATERLSVGNSTEPISTWQAAKRRPAENVFVSRQRTAPADFPQFTYAESAKDENRTAPRAENGAVFRRQHRVGSSTISQDLPPLQNLRDAEAAANGPAFPAQRGENALPVVAPEAEPTRKSRLVQTSSLIHLLKTNTVSSELQGPSPAAPAASPQTGAEQEPAEPAARSAPAAVTVDAVLDELEDRLRFEFLRTYGSSGE